MFDLIRKALRKIYAPQITEVIIEENTRNYSTSNKIQSVGNENNAGLLQRLNKRFVKYIKDTKCFKVKTGSKNGELELDLDSENVLHPKNSSGGLPLNNHSPIFLKCNLSKYGGDVSKLLEAVSEDFADKPKARAAFDFTVKTSKHIVLSSKKVPFFGDDSNLDLIVIIPENNKALLSHMNTLENILEEVSKTKTLNIAAMTNFAVCHAELPIPLNKDFKDIFKKSYIKLRDLQNIKDIEIQQDILKKEGVIRGAYVYLENLMGEGRGDLNIYVNTVRASHVSDGVAGLKTHYDQSGFDRNEFYNRDVVIGKAFYNKYGFLVESAPFESKFIENSLNKPHFIEVTSGKTNISTYFPRHMAAYGAVLVAESSKDFSFANHEAVCLDSAKSIIDNLRLKISQIGKARFKGLNEVVEVQADSTINPTTELLTTTQGKAHLKEMLLGEGFEPPVWVNDVGFFCEHKKRKINALLILVRPANSLHSGYGFVDKSGNFIKELDSSTKMADAKSVNVADEGNINNDCI